MSGKRRWRTKKAEKEYERLKREIAQRESDARSESQARQERIKVLWGLKEQDLKAKTYKERKLNEQKLKAQKLKKLLNCIKDLAENDELADQMRELVELAGLQDREIEYLAQFRCDWERIRSHYPEQLENLDTLIFRAEVEQLIETGAIKLPKLTPKQQHERRRSRYRGRAGNGLIEYEFGGAGEAHFRKHSLCGGLGEPYQPTCLDKIFAGGAVKMHESEGERMSFWSPQHRIREPGLQNLFGMHRNRFPKNLSSDQIGRERLYDYRAVAEIMDALLSEERKPRQKPGRGRSLRTMWLSDPSDPDLRNRVLSGIEARISSISVSKEIAGKFLAVIQPHLHNSAKK